MSNNADQPRDPDGRWGKKRAGGVAGAALLAGLMAASGGGGATTGSVGTALETAGQRAVHAKTMRQSRNAAKRGNERKAWNRMGLRRVRNDVKRTLRCSAHSYGEVQEFFLRHPCETLRQRLFAVGDSEGNIIAVSLMWVTMPSRADVSRLRRVEDTYGTGDVTPVGTQLLGFGGFRFTGKHYESRRKGSQFVITETEPVRGNPSNRVLDDVAVVANLLPAPS
ncbi:hypothetical protein GCM10009854_18100 [Saccharopolyspora halophila]|uniref:Secreted protein n=1 Tax=Saccharopolyspora halophila TaxID=405551 RepID=A0ABN3G0Y9_9PSEU